MIEVTKEEVYEALKALHEERPDDPNFNIRTIRVELIPGHRLWHLLSQLESEGKVIRQERYFKIRKNRAKIRA